MDQIAAMKAFQTVVTAGGFSAAAKMLQVSHTVVSRQVTQLEALLGTQLLNRTTRRFALTEAGQTYHEYSTRILEQLEEATLAVTRHQMQPLGVLRINAPMSFGLQELAQWLPAFGAAYPGVKVDLVCNDRFVDLIEEGFDVGLRLAYALSDSTLIIKRLATCEEWWVASPAYLQKHGTPRVPADLAQHNCLVYSLMQKANQPTFTGPDGSAHAVAVTGSLQANSGIALRAAANSATLNGATADSDAVNVAQLRAVNGNAIAAASKWIIGSPTTYVAPTSSGTDSTAVGSGASVSGNNSVAVGTGATATTDNSVALGNGSTTGTAVATPSVTIRGETYNFAGATPAGVVSVGSAGQERQIGAGGLGVPVAVATPRRPGRPRRAASQALQPWPWRRCAIRSSRNVPAKVAARFLFTGQQ